MQMKAESHHDFFANYSSSLMRGMESFDWEYLGPVVDLLFQCWKNRNRIFFCGNGGSAANANHIANDMLYGVNEAGQGLDVISLATNIPVLTCLANDVGYEDVFRRQVADFGKRGDVLWVLSGSGNSMNIVLALEEARKLGLKTVGLFGFDGGRGKRMVDHLIHFQVNDMQMCEDFQQIVGHMLTRRLKLLIAEVVADA